MVPIREVLEGIRRAVVVGYRAVLQAAAATTALALAGVAVTLYCVRPAHGFLLGLGVSLAAVLLGLELAVLIRLWRIRHILAGG